MMDTLLRHTEDPALRILVLSDEVKETCISYFHSLCHESDLVPFFIHFPLLDPLVFTNITHVGSFC